MLQTEGLKKKANKKLNKLFTQTLMRVQNFNLKLNSTLLLTFKKRYIKPLEKYGKWCYNKLVTY